MVFCFFFGKIRCLVISLQMHLHYEKSNLMSQPCCRSYTGVERGSLHEKIESRIDTTTNNAVHDDKLFGNSGADHDACAWTFRLFDAGAQHYTHERGNARSETITFERESKPTVVSVQIPFSAPIVHHPFLHSRPQQVWILTPPPSVLEPAADNFPYGVV